MDMSEQAFLSAVQKVTSGGLSLADLINETGQLGRAGAPALAQQLYKIWISFNREHPQLYVAHFNCSGLESQLGDNAAAEESLRAAIAVNPDFTAAYINLGGILERRGELDQAVEQWRTAASRLVPITGSSVAHVVTALKQIVRVLSDHQQNDIAETALRQCLEIDPRQRDVVEQFVALRLAQCKWPIVAPWEGVSRKALMTGIHPLSVAVYTDDPLLHLASGYNYCRVAVNEKPASTTADRRHAPVEPDQRRLRVGYVSSDLRDHAIGYLMVELFELHDRSKVEVFAYYCGRPAIGALNTRIKAAVEHWCDISQMGDDEAAQKIAADGIDILVDVNGHTRDARTAVFARRPAPIQVNWLGYPGSMGSPYHHYLIADDWIVPPEAEAFYSEKVLRLACYQPNDRKRVIAPEAPMRESAGLPDQAMVFCCFNGTHKISRFTFERWLEILRRTPDGVLWLLESANETQARLGDFAEARGVARDRLVYAPKILNAAHLARYPLADLFLDTVPYGAHTTASDALWMGVPVLTLSGRSFASRVCGSLVRSAGLPEMVCERPEDYVELAVALGADRPRLLDLRARLEASRSSCDLFATERLAARLEDLYREMADDYRAGRLPRPDLDNLDLYFEAGTGLDHEAREMLAVEDYLGLYCSKLAERHLMRPIRPDARLWTRAETARIDASPQELEAAAPRRRRQAG
jgi:predicted O-linked N-acetylglucosamine transferase (SPINDLY family)